MSEPREGIEAEVETPEVEAELKAPSVREVINRTLLLGVGAAALTADRAQSVIDEFVKRGQLSAEEGREMVEDLGKRSREEAKSTANRFEGTLHSTYKEIGLASRRELEDLDFRLRQLEHRIGLLERASDADDTPAYE